MTPNPNAVGAVSPQQASTPTDDIRKLLASILETLDKTRRDRQDRQGELERQKEEREKKAQPQFWKGAQKSLRAVGGITGNQIADTIGNIQKYASGLQEMYASLSGMFSGKAKQPQGAAKQRRKLPKQPKRQPTVRVMPQTSPGRSKGGLPYASPPLTGSVSWSKPTPPLAPLSPKAQAWLNPPIMPSGSSAGAPPALGWTPPAVAGTLPSTLQTGGGTSGQQMQQAMLQVLQQILSAIRDLEQEEDDTGPGATGGERERDRNEHSSQARGTTASLHGLPPPPPAQEEGKGMFDKAMDFLAVVGKAIA